MRPRESHLGVLGEHAFEECGSFAAAAGIRIDDELDVIRPHHGSPMVGAHEGAFAALEFHEALIGERRLPVRLAGAGDDRRERLRRGRVR